MERVLGPRGNRRARTRCGGQRRRGRNPDPLPDFADGGDRSLYQPEMARRGQRQARAGRAAMAEFRCIAEGGLRPGPRLAFLGIRPPIPNRSVVLTRLGVPLRSSDPTHETSRTRNPSQVWGRRTLAAALHTDRWLAVDLWGPPAVSEPARPFFFVGYPVGVCAYLVGLRSSTRLHLLCIRLKVYL